MISKNIQADIFEILQDGKIHTAKEISDKVEISTKTVYRHIQALAYRFNIQTFKGGVNKGGIRLMLENKISVERLSGNELQLIIENLSQLQNSSVNFKKFIKDLSTIKENKESEGIERI